MILDGDDLYAVNAGSNSITRFSVHRSGLEWEATVPSGGTMPISLTVNDHLLYVLNGGAPTNISGFDTHGDGLTPIPGSTRAMGPGATGPAQISFNRNGHVLVVTEKTTSSIETFYVDNDVPDNAAVFSATGNTPFGFDFDKHGNLLTSNASGSASSYSLSHEGRVNVISGAVPTFQGAPCWLVTSKDGRYAYTANAGPGTISGFTIGNDGTPDAAHAGRRDRELGRGHAPDRRGGHEGRLPLQPHRRDPPHHRLLDRRRRQPRERGLHRRPAGRRLGHRRELAAPRGIAARAPVPAGALARLSPPPGPSSTST